MPRPRMQCDHKNDQEQGDAVHEYSEQHPNESSSLPEGSCSWRAERPVLNGLLDRKGSVHDRRRADFTAEKRPLKVGCTEATTRHRVHSVDPEQSATPSDSNPQSGRSADAGSQRRLTRRIGFRSLHQAEMPSRQALRHNHPILGKVNGLSMSIGMQPFPCGASITPKLIRFHTRPELEPAARGLPPCS
jgi:hypothetical protein